MKLIRYKINIPLTREYTILKKLEYSVLWLIVIKIKKDIPRKTKEVFTPLILLSGLENV